MSKILGGGGLQQQEEALPRRERCHLGVGELVHTARLRSANVPEPTGPGKVLDHFTKANSYSLSGYVVI